MATDLTLRVLDTRGCYYNIQIAEDASVKQLRIIVEEVSGVGGEAQRLIYRGRLLTDEDTLRSAGLVASGLVLHLFARPKQQPALSTSIIITHDGPNDGYGAIDIRVEGLDSETLQLSRQVQFLSAVIFLGGFMFMMFYAAILIAIWEREHGGTGGERLPLHRLTASDVFRILGSVGGTAVGIFGMRAAATFDPATACWHAAGVGIIGALCLVAEGTKLLHHLLNYADRDGSVDPWEDEYGNDANGGGGSDADGGASSMGSLGDDVQGREWNTSTASKAAGESLLALTFAFFMWLICLRRAHQFHTRVTGLASRVRGSGRTALYIVDTSLR